MNLIALEKLFIDDYKKHLKGVISVGTPFLWLEQGIDFTDLFSKDLSFSAKINELINYSLPILYKTTKPLTLQLKKYLVFEFSRQNLPTSTSTTTTKTTTAESAKSTESTATT